MLRPVIDMESLLAMSPRDAAVFWLVRQDQVDDPDDDAAFQRWLDADPANGLAWADACAAWQAFGAATGAEMTAAREAANDARPSRRWPFAVAASVALAAGIGGVSLWMGQPEIRPGATAVPMAGGPSEAPQRFAAAVGSRRTVKLADGSQVVLDTGSAILVQFTPEKRDIQLVGGQASFAVKHDTSRPFVVTVGAHTITDIGTRFEARSLPDGLRVILIEGSVRVADKGGAIQPIELKAGQQLDVTGKNVSVSQATLATASDWQHGIVTFEGTALSDAVEELNRYATSRTLLVRDPEVARIRISGGFHTDDIGKFARSIAELYPVRIVETPRTVEIVSRKAGRR